jgi:hypothetical protein
VAPVLANLIARPFSGDPTPPASFMGAATSDPGRFPRQAVAREIVERNELSEWRDLAV